MTQHRLLAAERRQRDLLVVLVAQGEVGGLRRRLRSSFLPPADLRPASRAADQSVPTVVTDVCDSPAMEAASAMSDGST